MSKIKQLPLIIYQNTYFTDSLISIIEEGLTDVEKEKLNNESKKDVGLEVKAESQSILGLLPFIGYLQGKGNLNFSNFRSLEQDKKITDSYRFSKIKEYISKENITCTEIDEKVEFNKLEIGQFVDFTSNYKKNEIRELVDMLLNEDTLDLFSYLIPQISNDERFYKGYMQEVEVTGNYDPKSLLEDNPRLAQVKGTYKRVNKENKQKTDLTKTIYNIIERLKKDFPEEATTLDFYGEIQSTKNKNIDIRNFLICDTKFFVQEDKNRILDGKYRVFGKIIDIQDEITIESENSIEKAFSQLDRNQFFKRTTDESIQKLQSFIENLISTLKDQKDPDGKKWFNSKIDLITKGKAIKVLPIVIYT